MSVGYTREKLVEIYSEMLEIFVREYFMPVEGKCLDDLTNDQFLGLIRICVRFDQYFEYLKQKYF